MSSNNRISTIKIIASVSVLSLGLTGCSGTSAEDDAAVAAGSNGYEYGASPEEIQAAFEEVEPLTIIYQPSAQSPATAEAYRADAFIDNLESLSGGKITVETTYAQGIAGYNELPDALVDGRVDIAYLLPVYQPDLFPVFQSWVTGTTLTGTSPLVDELASNAAIGELTWGDESLISEFRDQGIEPLHIFNADGSVLRMCGQERSGDGDWQGHQVRASSQAQNEQLRALNASAVSMEYTEVFEGLQRNTLDCTLSTPLAADAGGILEAAPHLSYTNNLAFARGPGGVYAGSAWDSWPLVVQQLVFDSMKDEFAATLRGNLDGTYIAAETVREQNGTFTEIGADTQDKLRTTSEALVEEEVNEGNLPEGSTEAIPETVDQWRHIAADLGYEDDGSFVDFDEWYNIDDTEYIDAFAERYFDEVMLPHRPS